MNEGKSYAILPCNGLDKTAGCMTRELAFQIQEQTMRSEIICPTFVRVSDNLYKKSLDEKELLVIDGCGTRCAGKLAAERGYKISAKINIADECRKYGIDLGTSLRLTEKEIEGCGRILSDLFLASSKGGSASRRESEEYHPQEKRAMASNPITAGFPKELTYETYVKDKFIFRLPKDENFFFNENDCWAYVSGNKARIGVTDFVQKSLSDIMFFTPPGVGSAVEQFEDAGEIESGKAIYEIISPVSGTVSAVNTEILDHPEYINDNPYEQGWIAEIELSNFESDKELLLQYKQYFAIMKRKVDEFHV